MKDTIGIEATNGDILLVELDEQARVLRVLDEGDHLIRAYSFDQFASLTSGLVLDEDATIVIDVATVAELIGWANLDAIGQALRGEDSK